MARIWVDIEDLLAFVEREGAPSGIQRVTFEICAALATDEALRDRIGFVRHETGRNSFRAVSWDHAAATIRAGTTPTMRVRTQTASVAPYSRARLWLRGKLQLLPASLQTTLLRACRQSVDAARGWGQFCTAVLAWARLQLRSRPHETTEAASALRFDEAATAGDVIVALGGAWAHPDYAALIRPQRARGRRFALLLYDLIPLRHPEWCGPGLVRRHRHFVNSVLPICDIVFAISRATAADVEAYAAENAIALPRAVCVLPMGSGFSDAEAPLQTPRLPPPGSYALFVSTIEARKNHLLAFRVWRQLLRDLPRELVPTLVFAGREGWLVRDLMQQIANSNNLDGKLLVIDTPSDAELAALYQGCLFTLFPSLAEGWGLPITESLAFGKPCLAADNTALPEAGMGLTRSFDADNLRDAMAKIRAVIEHPAELAAWEALIRTEFRPIGWSDAAAALLREIDTVSGASDTRSGEP